MKRVAWLGLLVCAGLFCLSASRPAQQPPAQGVMPTPDWLSPPPTVYPPKQADLGAQVYYYVCLVCHGDRGQGLTAWRQQLTPPDDNCWRSKCHAPNHLDNGFTFPKEVPAVVAPGFLVQFKTALGLHDFLQARMPWQAPGSLKADEYWQLTAYLMRANGVDPGSVALNETTAAAFRFEPAVATPTVRAVSPWLWAALALAGIVLAIFFVLRHLRG